MILYTACFGFFYIQKSNMATVMKHDSTELHVPYSFSKIVQSECFVYLMWRSDWMFFQVRVQNSYSKILWLRLGNGGICGASSSEVLLHLLTKLLVVIGWCWFSHINIINDADNQKNLQLGVFRISDIFNLYCTNF
jgi:hypothetical protein